VTGCNAVLLLARAQWQLRQLRNIRRDPPRLIFGEQLGGIGETQRSKTLAEKIYTHRENYSFFGRHGRLYGLVQLPSPHRRAHFANARLKGGPASLRAAPFLDNPPRLIAGEFGSGVASLTHSKAGTSRYSPNDGLRSETKNALNRCYCAVSRFIDAAKWPEFEVIG
jgi:hypothetical protein